MLGFSLQELTRTSYSLLSPGRKTPVESPLPLLLVQPDYPGFEGRQQLPRLAQGSRPGKQTDPTLDLTVPTYPQNPGKHPVQFIQRKGKKK